MGTVMEKTRPAVSVLVTVYNRKAYLAACLDSILASTWQDFEVVVVDDMSTDGSAELAERYAGSDTKIKFHRNQQNLGDYPNRMKAAELARGKYLKYVDSDDLIYRHSLAIMVEAMEANPDAALGVSHSLPEDDHPYPWKLSPQAAWQKQFLGRGCLGAGPSSAIIRKESFFGVGGFGECGVLNDRDLWYRMSARWPIVLMPPGLVWWRRHEQQEFTKDDAARVYLEGGYRLAMEALNSPECPLNGDEREIALARASQHHARRILALALRHRQPTLAWHLFRSCGLGIGDLLSGMRRYR